MRTFAAGLSSVLLAAAGFNLWANPGGLWRGPALPPLAPWSEGQVLVTPPDFDERGFQARRVAALEAGPRVLVLGGSRAALVDSRMAPDGLFLNAWMSGIAMSDYAALWQKTLDARKTPERLILFIDPEALASPKHARISWNCDTAALSRFIVSQLGADALRKVLKQVVMLPLDRTLMLITSSVLQASWAEMRRRATLGARDFRLVPESSLAAHEYGRRPDGALVYPARHLAAKAASTLRDEARAAYDRGLEGTDLGGYAIDDFSMKLLVGVVSSARRSADSVTLVAPPYHPAALEALERRHPGLISAYLGALSSAAAATGAVFCDRHDAARAGCAEGEFLDERHARRSCIAKVMAGCVPKNPIKS